MTVVRIIRNVFLVICALALCGCFPSGQSASDEEKDPHFLAGRSRVSTMDYQGAIESFEKALEVNPRSAAAHFELGWLFAEKEPDPAAAIYHYEQYLKLRPNADNADVVRQHIQRLKQDLARAVMPLPSTPGQQREADQLAAENRRLRDELEKWRAYYVGRAAAPPNPSGGSVTAAKPAQVLAPAQTAPSSVAPSSAGAARPSSASTEARTYKVQAGDTPSSIARKYGVKLDALMAANPGLDPKRLRVGQTLNVPAP